MTRLRRPAQPPVTEEPSVQRRQAGFGAARRPAALLLAALMALVPAAALAHGASEAPGVNTLWTWEFDPYALLPVVVGTSLYLWLVDRVNARHPLTPVPRRRTVAFLLAIGAFLVAVASPIAVYDDDLFSAHMVQHMLLVFAVPPLLLFSAPMTLPLRAVRPETRRRLLLPFLHSTALEILLFPVLTWLAFVVTLWGTHFTPIYDDAVQNLWLHRLEHFFYVATALMFWWPIVHIDPGPWRLPHLARIMYLALAMAQLIFFSLVLVSASSPLYSSYEASERTWGPSALTDQQAGAALMWIMGVMVFIGGILLVAYDMMRTEERVTARRERREAALRSD